MSAASIRTLISNNPRTVHGYPQQVRDAVARYAQARRAHGIRWCELEAEFGISGASMRLWMRVSTRVVMLEPA